jgi:serine/threonine protein kinase
VLHRDTKPSNVLIAKDGEVFLTDFGLSRFMENASSLTGDMLIGTPDYISPEQAMNAGSIDEGTDIYSFGVMIYEMVTGCLPFRNDVGFAVIEDHLYKDPPRPTSVKPDLPQEMDAVILKALQKQRKQRYAKISELVNAFNKIWPGYADKADDDISSTTMESLGVAALVADTGQTFPIREGTIILGRNSATKNIQNDIDLTDLDVKKIISRRHAMIQRTNQDFILHDLESRNGTFVNGLRLSANHPHRLAPGDVIEFGTGGVKLKFIN